MNPHSADATTWTPSLSERILGISLFFDRVSPFLPFLHRPTFDMRHAPTHLVLSMCSLGYQYAGDFDLVGSGSTGPETSLQCHHAALRLVDKAQTAAQSSHEKLEIIQAYLLLQICAMLYLGGKECSNGLRSHSKMIAVGAAYRDTIAATDMLCDMLSALPLERSDATSSNQGYGDGQS